MGLGKIVGKVIGADKVLDTIDKAVTDKDLKNSLKCELEKLSVERLKVPFMEKVIKLTFPCIVWVACFGIFVNIIKIAMTPEMLYTIDDLHFEIIKWFIIGLFGRKITGDIIK